MKKMFLSLIMINSLALSTAVFAGGVKDLMIDAEEAIMTEFHQTEHQVESITNYSFAAVKNGIGIKADVETINNKSRLSRSWICLVTFLKENNSYFPANVNCN